MYRLLDLILSFVGLLLLWPVLLVLIFIGFFDTGSPLFCQERVGQNQKPFILVKLRSMRRSTPSVASHLAEPSYVTRFGGFVRHTKLDELPQLWNVLKGDMSLVGPRPCLLVQQELIEARDKLGVFDVRPGITGLAQINKIDMSTPSMLARYDADMICSMSLQKYFAYLFLTILGKGRNDGIKPTG